MSTHYDKALYTATNVALKDLLVDAFGVKPFQIQCPAWMETTRFNISAKLPEGASKEQINAMLQKLLVERFKMEVRRDQKEMAAFLITVAKGGLKMKESTPDSDVDTTPAAARDSGGSGSVSVTAGGGVSGALNNARSGRDSYPTAGKGGFSSQTSQGRTRVAANAQTVEGLAKYLSRMLRQEVVDKTGLTGKYDFRLEFFADPQSRQGAAAPDANVDPEGPTVFRALQDQLGLKLEAGKATLEAIVIEKAEKTPIEN